MRSLQISLSVRNPFYNLTHSFGAWKQENESWAISDLIIQHILYQFFSDEKNAILSAQKNHFFGFIVVLIQFLDTLILLLFPKMTVMSHSWVSWTFVSWGNCEARSVLFPSLKKVQFSIRIRAKKELDLGVKLSILSQGVVQAKLWTNHFFQVGNCSLCKSRGKATPSLLEMCLWNGYFWQTVFSNPGQVSLWFQSPITASINISIYAPSLGLYICTLMFCLLAFRQPYVQQHLLRRLGTCHIHKRNTVESIWVGFKMTLWNNVKMWNVVTFDEI